MNGGLSPPLPVGPCKNPRALPTQNPIAFPAVPLTVVGLTAFDGIDPVKLLQQDHEGKFVLEGQGA